MQQKLPIATLNQPIAVDLGTRIEHARSSLVRNLPRFTDLPQTKLPKLDRAAIVSGGPSLAGNINAVAKFDVVVACGSCHDYLIDNGIIPKYCVIFDPGADHARFYRNPQKDTIYLVSSTCAPEVFDDLAGLQVRVWHPFDDVPWDIYGAEPRIGGGSSATLRGVALCHVMGLRELHMFGFDCSFANGAEHAYPYNQDRPAPISVSLNGRQFLTTPALLQQAQEFFRMYNDFQHVLAAVIYGDGLAACMWEAGARHTLAEYA